MGQSEPPISAHSAINETQRKVLLAGAVIAAVALLFPPWSHSGGSFGGFSFILSPPRTAPHINSSLLFLELVGLALIVWFLFVAARNVTAKVIGKRAMAFIISSVILAIFLFGWFVWPKSYTETAGVRAQRFTGTRYVWSLKKGWITEAEKKDDDVAEAKPVLEDLNQIFIEDKEGEADHVVISNPTHWNLAYSDTKITVEYYRQKSGRNVLLKIGESELQIAPGLNDIFLPDARTFVGSEPLLEKIKITAGVANGIGSETLQVSLVPPFLFERQRTCRTQNIQTQNDPEDPYLVTTTSKVICRV